MLKAGVVQLLSDSRGSNEIDLLFVPDAFKVGWDQIGRGEYFILKRELERHLGKELFAKARLFHAGKWAVGGTPINNIKL